MRRTFASAGNRTIGPDRCRQSTRADLPRPSTRRLRCARRWSARARCAAASRPASPRPGRSAGAIAPRGRRAARSVRRSARRDRSSVRRSPCPPRPTAAIHNSNRCSSRNRRACRRVAASNDRGCAADIRRHAAGSARARRQNKRASAARPTRWRRGSIRSCAVRARSSRDWDCIDPPRGIA